MGRGRQRDSRASNSIAWGRRMSSADVRHHQRFPHTVALTSASHTPLPSPALPTHHCHHQCSLITRHTRCHSSLPSRPALSLPPCGTSLRTRTSLPTHTHPSRRVHVPVAADPVHFHLQQSSGHASYVRWSSVHRSFYRCVAIHGSNGVSVSENVAYADGGTNRRNNAAFPPLFSASLLIAGNSSLASPPQPPSRVCSKCPKCYY